MSFFTSTEVTTGAKLLEILYIIIGLLLLNTGIRNLNDKANEKRIGTAIFWIILGIVIALGRWIPAKVVGVLVVLMALPAIFNQVSYKTNDIPTKEYTKAVSDKLGYKIFIPAFVIGLTAVIFATMTKLGALVGVGVGVALAMITLYFMNKDNTLNVYLKDSKRFLDLVGPLSMLPMFLASLGAVFTQAGVGQVVSDIVGNIIPEGNIVVGIIVYAIGMALFTMVMGNAFAAITVMTVGIGAPFVLAQGANPTLIGMLALTCGYCGTLMTPMAANFNIVPVAILEMKDKNGVIKNQVVPALIMLTVQIIYMIMFS